MKITDRSSGDVTIIDVLGKVVFGEGEEEFRRVASGLIESGRVKLVLNLAEVPYVDSAGISEIVRVYVTASKRGGQMKLLSLTRRVQEVLTITKLLTVFETFDSEDEAVASFGGSPQGA